MHYDRATMGRRRSTVRLTPAIADIPGKHRWRLLAVAVSALALGACSKCDMPTWHRDTPGAPQSCHDDAGVK
jgi:hypothetical protein